ncbi:PREDICTED: ras-specific guanine nucleotide-releasing factor 2-like [Ceratosolen solmsi marchali]|uniref:Ras-specific guanine nucleotide-releasing factor 2-like n=1 Tax=Ceratosolen solmsi marchali TaxID=326594 RepID=A0AAJ7DYL8_9HYME|nr:PREDICTED: ras-specific guanine nucleotide-releasing factor 2-like [Ceratosolen solmsi marchali]
MLSEKAHYDHSLAGYLHKRTADLTKWQLRWFVLYQNILFYYDNDSCSRPSGVILLEGCYCNRLITVKGRDSDKQIYFAISYRKENQRQYELKSATEAECKMWIDAITEASFNKMLLQKEELEQKHLHLLEIVRSEKMAKWQYTQQCDEFTSEIKKLRAELSALKKEFQPNFITSYGESFHGKFQRISSQSLINDSTASQFSLYGNGSHGTSGVISSHSIGLDSISEGSVEMQKIKKVQSFFRGWLCRRRWKQIVEQYIKSPHAESMRKRNSLVFQMVEAEEEYTEQMEVLVSCFLRPFKMAASSKKPPCSHEDVNSIFLNSETVLFLHQIFLKGLTSRMENWPTLVLGDLFDMLLPMLSIYQEYVRNHHYSLQVLTECKQSSSQFSALLSRLEIKTVCDGRSLEMFLTYPMHQIPRYIITLHELLAHTPHDHVERKSLQNARQQLENLSRQMHDEVSETENLRKNLAVERMIVEGCDILLDVNQVFVRQGTLIQISEKPKNSRKRFSATFGGKNLEKETLRQCFLFSNHLILTTRQSDDDGRLNLVPQIGKIPLSDAVLVEDPSEQSTADDDELSVCSMSSGISESSGSGSTTTTTSTSNTLLNRDFKIIFDLKTIGDNRQYIIHLLAPTMQEKAAWISDLSQCMDNVHFNGLLHGSLSDTSSIIMPQSIRNDPKLFKDDTDIRFSRTLNSCKVPQIRYATPDRLLQRLTDLRFLSIDFLNTFLLTYRVFTDGITVLEALKKVFYDSEPSDVQISRGSIASLDVSEVNAGEIQQLLDDPGRNSSALRRTSGASSVSGYDSEVSENRETGNYSITESSSSNYTPNTKLHCRNNYKIQEQQLGLISEINHSSTSEIKKITLTDQSLQKVNTCISDNNSVKNNNFHLTIPQEIAVSSSAETLSDITVISAPTSPSNLSSVTLVGSVESDSCSGSDKSLQGTDNIHSHYDSKNIGDTPIVNDEFQFTYEGCYPPSCETTNVKSLLQQSSSNLSRNKDAESSKKECDWPDEIITCSEPTQSSRFRNSQNYVYTNHRASINSVSSSTTKSGSISLIFQNYWINRRSTQDSDLNLGKKQSFHQHNIPQSSSKAGVVITSFRKSHRRSSTSTSATAFAIATSASSNPPDKIIHHDDSSNRVSNSDKSRRKESVMSTAATMRVLNVLRHWISKHSQDFELDFKLKKLTIEFLEDIIYSPNLLPAEHKAASQLLRLITKEETNYNKVDLNKLLQPPLLPSIENIESLSALEIAEQMTYLDHQIFISIASEEFLGQAWMKTDKAIKAPNINLMTKRFNEVSQLVISEIVRRSNMQARVAAIEKWTAVADISRVLHNYNGVLQICAAFTSSSVFRLKKTWEKVSKQSKQTIERLQIIVSSEHRFKNLRDALHRCDPPCIPYLGLYLTDLSFIEEGTPNFTDDGLLNFSKMRMIAHVIREIRHFQQTPYKIELITKVTNYLLDPTLLLEEEDLYRMSLNIEPRSARLSSSTLIGLPPSINLKKDT